VAIHSLATKPDGEGGAYLLYWYQDQTADLWHQVPGRPGYCLIGRQVIWKVRAEMAQHGIAEDGWSPG
jgi:hypothetical protein